ncbi:MAG: oxidoreductase [Anaerolineales bacterium]|nr:SDR family oxidoreductase [Anaerolineae bacterium]PWB73383.1 MAG: oxidoreductase [Anaerolineales bacterium]
MDIKGKVIIVTGASSGIGEATARQFGREGAQVVLAARRVDRLESLAQEIAALNTSAETLVVQADLSRLQDIESLIRQTMDRFGRIDVLVNNAGFGRLNWLEKLDPVSDIQAQFDVNVMGVIQTTRQALPIMIEQRSGHIINMCSMAGLVATPTYTIYAACKHAVHGFSEALRREVKPWGIDVSMIYPGGVVTEFAGHAGIQRKTKATTPKALLLTADQVGEAVVKLVRRPRPMWIIPWAWTFTVWMNRNLNRLVDRTTIQRFTIPEREEELKAIDGRS